MRTKFLISPVDTDNDIKFDAECDDLLHAITLTLFVPGAWMVRDSRVHEGRDGSLLGLIQEEQGGYEVTQLGTNFMWCSFETIGAAIGHIARTNREMMAARRSDGRGFSFAPSPPSLVRG